MSLYTNLTVYTISFYKFLGSDRTQSESIQNPNYRISCFQHDNEQASRWCSDCKIYICFDCYLGHNEHNLDRLIDMEARIVQGAIRQIQDGINFLNLDSRKVSLISVLRMIFYFCRHFDNLQTKFFFNTA